MRGSDSGAQRLVRHGEPVDSRPRPRGHEGASHRGDATLSSSFHTPTRSVASPRPGSARRDTRWASVSPSLSNLPTVGRSRKGDQ